MRILLLVLFCFPILASADVRVSTHIPTGKVLGYNTDGKGFAEKYTEKKRLDMLKQNYLSLYPDDEIEVKYVTDEEFKQIKYNWLIKPAEEKIKKEKAEKKVKEAKIKEKLGLSDSDLEDLKDIIK